MFNVVVQPGFLLPGKKFYMYAESMKTTVETHSLEYIIGYYTDLVKEASVAVRYRIYHENIIITVKKK